MMKQKPTQRIFVKGLKPILIDKFKNDHGPSSPPATTRALKKNFFYETDVKKRSSILSGLSPARSSSKVFDSLPSSVQGGKDNN